MIDKALEEVLNEIQPDKGFQIKCLNCGSTDCHIELKEAYGFDIDETIYNDYYVLCEICGQKE